jgi:hypothetical protein
MRKMFMLVSVFLLGLTWALAQDATQASPSAGSASAQTSGQSNSAAGEKTVTGCLSGSNGNFTLTDKHGRSYQLTGDTAKLAEHVGHEVKVTGSPSSSAATGGAAPSRPSAAS